MKVRRIDFSPDEYLAGTAEMSPEQAGVYWWVCSLIYSRGEALPDDDRENARLLRLDARTWKRLKADLLRLGKLSIDGGAITNARCAIELERARKRMQNAHDAGARGGRPRKVGAPKIGPTIGQQLPQLSANSLANCRRTDEDNSVAASNDDKDLAKPLGFVYQKPNHQPSTNKEELVPPTGGEGYRIAGKIVRLDAADFQKWQARYHGIADLEAALMNYDEWLDANATGQERQKWYYRAQQRMNAIHQAALAAQRKPGGANLNESW